eukprot:9483892-Pyramimonas_sp.AAC.1
MERADVRANARKISKPTHFANTLELSAVKHDNLLLEAHMFMGRVVARGDSVKNEGGLAAAFADASSASCIEASKLRDAAALLPDGGGEHSDAPVACTQALLYGDGRIDPG